MSLLTKGDNVAIVACSDLINSKSEYEIHVVAEKLQTIGLNPILSPLLVQPANSISSYADKKAEILNSYFSQFDIKAIFDISGGDLANEVISKIDFEAVRNNPKIFAGYSDLTCIINSIYTKTQNISMLYQIRHIADPNIGNIQLNKFAEFVFAGNRELIDFRYRRISGGFFKGIALGGNIRCLLKLAGTEFFPDINGKILFLESLSGKKNRLIAYFSQLKMMGVFDRISGLVLGTFSEAEALGIKPEELIKDFVSPNLPIIKTQCIGHGKDSSAVIIGSHYEFI